jgi:hypothetical protein
VSWLFFSVAFPHTRWIPDGISVRCLYSTARRTLVVGGWSAGFAAHAGFRPNHAFRIFFVNPRGLATDQCARFFRKPRACVSID